MIEQPSRIATVAVFGKDKHGDDALLMGLRRDNMRWTTPGGHFNDCESPIQAAQRELFEETGISVAPEEMSYLGSMNTVGHGSGRPIELHMFQVDGGDRVPRVTEDPDDEVHGWSYVSVSNGLPAGLKQSLHVPKNQLLRSLGLMDFEEDKPTVRLANGERRHIAPMSVRRDAAEGLRTAAMLGWDMGDATKRAKNLVAGKPMTDRDVHDLASYFALYATSAGENDINGAPTKRSVEGMLWGGLSGARWSRAMSATIGGPVMRMSSGDHSTSSPYPVGTHVEINAGPEKYKTGKITAVKKNGMGQVAYTIDPDDFRDESYYVPHGYVSKLAADTNADTSKTDDKVTKEVVAGGEAQEAGVDDNDNDPENDREIPNGPRRKTDGEMKDNPHEELET